MDKVSSPNLSPKTKRTYVHEDFLSRFRRFKQKLHSLKVKRTFSESLTNLRIPRINNNSKRIANSLLLSSENLKKTKNPLKNSRFFPRTIKTSLFEIHNFSPESQNSESLQSRGISISTSRSESLLFYPSLAEPSKKNKEKLPADILARNKLLFSLRQEALGRGFVKEHQEPIFGFDIFARSSKWLLEKLKKIEKSREKFEKNDLKNCTFQPSIRKNKGKASDEGKKSFEDRETGGFKVINVERIGKGGLETRIKAKKEDFQRLSRRDTSAVTSPRIIQTLASESSMNAYTSISPVRFKIAYKAGFSKDLKFKSTPMLDYKKINFRS